MPTFDQNFGFKLSPFDKYVAEREPDINLYAVKPPYFEETRRRISTQSSYILFGFRGSGKSATRLTAEKETWVEGNSESKRPLLVSLNDFNSILRRKVPKDATDFDIVKRTAFLTIEAMLLWMSNQPEGAEFVNMLDEEEYSSLASLASAFYLTEPEENRAVSQTEAMKLLHHNWANIAGVWVNKKWSSISVIIGKIASAFSKAKLGTEDIGAQVVDLLSQGDSSQSCRLVMQRLAESAQALGFSGVVVLVDKVDEHTKTQKSHSDAAQLIHPIVSQVQLMEVDGS